MIRFTGMPLDEYQRKRDFSTTPEPSGDDAPRSRRRRKTAPERSFSVQKHLASHLHYDLRLEHNGVLLSWAVPKGPSLNAADRRMAVRPEDHPLAYGEFEGVIPKGYGAGIVTLWDRDTWSPEVDDVDAALKNGDLKFSLDGYKLKGSWALVRTRDGTKTSPKQRGRNWLLIKHRDFWSGPVDIAEFAPLSVKSAGDFDDILAEEMPDQWVTGRHGSATRGSAHALLVATIESAAAKTPTRQLSQAPATRTRAETAPTRAAGKKRATKARAKPATKNRKPREPR